MVDLSKLCTDLAAEHHALDGVIAGLGPQAWDTPTPAPGWTIRDQIAHLTFFDVQAAHAVRDPKRFGARLSEVASDVESFLDAPLQDARAIEPSEVLFEWRRARQDMLDAFATLDARARVPWFGPSMSAASFVTARLMEVWAHGQDVVDALGIERDATDRLRHVAHLGVRARAFSYLTNNRDSPDADVRVELKAPSGASWTWGTSATDRVTGDAVDFCLVVTQRRHLADTDLVVEGDVAREWMSIAQAFAGPPGAGRAPGQFRKRCT